MASDAPFAMERLAYADLEELAPLIYTSFPDGPVRELLIGCKDEANIPDLLKGLQEEWHEDPRGLWMKVTDRQTNKIVAATEWRLNFSAAPLSLDSTHPEWLDGEVKQRSMEFVNEVNAVRKQAMDGGGPYLYLHACFTVADYRRRGAGAMMMQWGVELADNLRIPTWIEASQMGAHLYKAFGFYLYREATIHGMTFRLMKRDAKTEPVLGGNAAPLTQ